MEKNLGGRPPFFKSPEEMQTKIDQYFEECDSVGKPYTITGLALAIGFVSRQALLNYQAKSKGFNDTITRAKAKVEEYAEQRLFDKEGSNGAKFSLSNNFKGWKENQAVELSGAVTFVDDLKKSDG